MIKRITALILTVCLLLSVSGCGFIMDQIETSKIETMVQESLGEYFDSKGSFDLNSKAKKKYDLSDLADEQKALGSYFLSKCSGFEIKDTKVNDGRKSAQCTVEFFKVPDLSSLDLFIATSDEYEDEIDSLKKKTVKISFKLVKNKNDEWIYSDLNKFFDTFAAPLKELCILDDEGNPLNITAAYIDAFYQESVWYDPLMGNPAEGDTLVSPVALVNYFYFKQPMVLTLTAVLMKDGDEVSRIEVNVNNSVVAKCDFDAGLTLGSSSFEAGSYTIAIMSGDITIAESAAVRVR